MNEKYDYSTLIVDLQTISAVKIYSKLLMFQNLEIARGSETKRFASLFLSNLRALSPLGLSALSAISFPISQVEGEERERR